MPLLPLRLSAALLSGVLAVSAAGASADTSEPGEAGGSTATAGPPQAGNVAPLTVQVSGLAEVTGHLYIALYDSEDTWLGDDTVLLRKVVIEDSRNGDLVEVPIGLPPGEYAMTVFYDEDDNGELNTSFIGMPKEPIALSNNATGKFGPPKFADAMFVIGAEPAVQSITMEEL